jgi:hypothetical protein
VAAYGFPVTEMTHGISQWIWPFEFADRELPGSVKRARHALAIDDERTIGGGYPDDSLAFVPLYWIMKEAQNCGLRFKWFPKADPDALRRARSSRDKDGRMYDSRQGIKSYYRYGPRRIYDLCHARFSHKQNDIVEICLPKIHESALKRMQTRAHLYAPLGLPEHYEVVEESGRILEPDHNPFETGNQAKARTVVQEQVWNFVWWRRIVYFLTVFASLNLLLFPIIWQTIPEHEFSSDLRFVSQAVRIAGAFLPQFVSDWRLDSYAANPHTFLFSVVVVIVLNLAGRDLDHRIVNEMGRAWKSVPLRHSWPIRLINSGVFKVRTSKLYKFVLGVLKLDILPAFTVVLTIYLLMTLTSHVAFNLRDAAGLVCTESEHPITVLADKEQKVTKERPFEPSSLCWASGLELVRSFRYEITIVRDESTPWRRNNYNTDLAGFNISSLPSVFSLESLYLRTSMFLEVPIRRVWYRPWFRIIARIGRLGAD